MTFIKTRKKIVSSAIVSSLSMVAASAMAEEQVIQLETIHQEVKAEKAPSLKVDQSANSKFVAPLLDTPQVSFSDFKTADCRYTSDDFS